MGGYKMYVTIIMLLILTIAVLLIYIYRKNKSFHKINSVLDDIADDNLDRKLITNDISDRSEFSAYCYKVNEIVKKYKGEIEARDQSVKSYKELITSLSHDLRTPLASLSGYLNAINDDVINMDEKKEFLNLSINKAETLKQYIDTLFLWLKLESKEQIFRFEPLDIGESLREIMTDWIPKLEQNKISYEIDIPDQEIMVLVDRESFRRIINNLISNIFVHSEATEIHIKMEKLKNDVSITVRDNGIGINKNDIKNIFKRMYKCDSARSNTGNGLGLSIADELAKANNACIHVESTPKKGAVFIVNFSKTSSL